MDIRQVTGGGSRLYQLTATTLLCVFFGSFSVVMGQDEGDVVYGANDPILSLRNSKKIRIGVLIPDDEKDTATELSMKYAIYMINKNEDILPNHTLVYDVRYVHKDNSFDMIRQICDQVRYGIVALFGPTDTVLGVHSWSVASSLGIPNINVRNDYEDVALDALSMNMYPQQMEVNDALQDLMEYLNWTRAAVIYEDELELVRLQDLIHKSPNREVDLFYRRTEPSNYREVMLQLKHKGLRNIIINTKDEHMQKLFRVILQLEMNNNQYHYIFTSLDLQRFNLEDFAYNHVNMTAFSLVSSESDYYHDFSEALSNVKPLNKVLLGENFENGERNVIGSRSALIYDAIETLARGINNVIRYGPDMIPKSLSCHSDNVWEDGQILANFISTVKFDGLTGPIRFSEGKRSPLQLNVIKLVNEKVKTVGSWKSTRGINITDPYVFIQGRPSNITLKVISRIERPFVMLKRMKATPSSINNAVVDNDLDSENMGNHRFEGFCVDLLAEIASHVGFNYEIHLISDNNYGALNKTTGEWNGLVGGLMKNKADLAMGAMTINYAREDVIDFTKPFLNLGISILYKIPSGKPTRLFSFMNPLAVEIWLYVLAAYILVSFTLYLMARFSPYEWKNAHPCETENIEVENQFSVFNSFWFITGTVLRQGSGLNPQATSTRIVGGIWWFFTLIIISSYTANLAAFLTVDRMITPIENAEDLANQNDISYGTLNQGSTMTFFRDSKINVYQRMWNYMNTEQPEVFVSDYKEGIRRVRNGDYAFLMESTVIDYVVQRDCNLTQIGGLLDSKGYGIATPKGSKWRDPFSLAILVLQEKGTIQMLYNKWWKNTGDVCTRQDKSKDSKANPLSVQNIGGVFVVLICGLSLAIIVAILEFICESRKNSRTHHNSSLCSEIGQELRFAMRCRGSRQRPALRKSCSKCSPENTYVPTALEFANRAAINSISKDTPISKIPLPIPKFDNNSKLASSSRQSINHIIPFSISTPHVCNDYDIDTTPTFPSPVVDPQRESSTTRVKHSTTHHLREHKHVVNKCDPTNFSTSSDEIMTNNSSGESSSSEGFGDAGFDENSSASIPPPQYSSAALLGGCGAIRGGESVAVTPIGMKRATAGGPSNRLVPIGKHSSKYYQAYAPPHPPTSNPLSSSLECVSDVFH